ncbi:Hypothetical predicted protein [Scomber scombrus]|uniref:Uncharacterized protein n=1 Tax=Scomber scombrus TaxID=13677 RepID=A0AAV1Q1T5_SCOSC
MRDIPHRKAFLSKVPSDSSTQTQTIFAATLLTASKQLNNAPNKQESCCQQVGQHQLTSWCNKADGVVVVIIFNQRRHKAKLRPVFG